MSSNEAAERPVDRLWMEFVRGQHPAEIAAFERAERRATVERIREAAMYAIGPAECLDALDAVLDEEAAR